MAAALVAGVLVGGGIYYLTRVGPRIARRVAMTQQGSASSHAAAATMLFSHEQPYHKYEYGFLRTMTEEEAYLLLGFSEARARSLLQRPSRDEVKEHYHAMMKQLHSDANGTPFIARKLNEARDLLIK